MRSPYYTVYYGKDTESNSDVTIKVIPISANPMICNNERKISNFIDSKFISKYNKIISDNAIWVTLFIVD